MANLSITAANVEPYAGATTKRGVAGAALTQGMAIYENSEGQMLAASNATQASANAAGICLTVSSRKQPVIYQSAGEMDVGATLTVGEIYVVANTAGGIHSADNLDVSGEFTTGDYPCILGTATEADRLVLAIKFTPEVKA